MTYKELSPANKRRFKTARCMCCMSEITPLEQFETLEMKYKRVKIVAFVHQDCIYRLAKTQMSSIYGKMAGMEAGHEKESN